MRSRHEATPPPQVSVAVPRFDWNAAGRRTRAKNEGHDAGATRVGGADSVGVSVTETFFSLDVEDMDRAAAFYVDALGAEVVFWSPGWTSLRIAGVRVALALSSEYTAGRGGLHFSVSDLASAGVAVQRKGGSVASTPVEVAPGVVVMQATDTEGNTFTLTGNAKPERGA